MSIPENDLDINQLSQISGLGELIYRESTPSTNTLAIELFSANKLRSPALIVTGSQTAGRGQFDRSWNSSAGSLTFSLAVEQAPQPYLPLMIGLTILESLEATQIEHSDIPPVDTTGWELKWPNDLLYANSKLGGILIETIPGKQQIVIGIGLNINNELPEIGKSADSSKPLPPIHLKSIVGKPISLTDVLSRIASDLLSCLASKYGREISTECMDSIHERLAYRGRTVHFESTSGSIVRGKLLGISRQGAIQIQSPEGLLTFFSGRIVGHSE